MSGSGKPLRAGNGSNGNGRNKKTPPTLFQVVAEIHVGGAAAQNGNSCVFNVLSTDRGMYLVSASKVSEPGKWIPVPTLREAVSRLPCNGNLRVLAIQEPDVKGSNFGVSFQDRRAFETSGFDFRSTGTRHVVVTLPAPKREVSKEE